MEVIKQIFEGKRLEKGVWERRGRLQQMMMKMHTTRKINPMTIIKYSSHSSFCYCFHFCCELQKRWRIKRENRPSGNFENKNVKCRHFSHNFLLTTPSPSKKKNKKQAVISLRVMWQQFIVAFFIFIFFGWESGLLHKSSNWR